MKMQRKCFATPLQITHASAARPTRSTPKHCPRDEEPKFSIQQRLQILVDGSAFEAVINCDMLSPKTELRGVKVSSGQQVLVLFTFTGLTMTYSWR